MSHPEGRFVWYELLTSDARAAEAFYAAVIGWRMADAGQPGTAYTLACAGEHRVGGIMRLPQEVCDQGGRPGWLGYVGVADVDAKAREAEALGGRVLRAADDIPNVGRFAVIADPQGAVLVLFTPVMAPQPPAPVGTMGLASWHELYARDWPSAFAFYEALFGWRKGEAVDLGPMGTYQLFGHGAEPFGGMMSLPQAPIPAWMYYFSVDDIDAAAERIRQAGGAITNGPMQVPGGGWIVQAADPQGAHFALLQAA